MARPAWSGRRRCSSACRPKPPAAILNPESLAMREAVAVPVVPAAPTGFRTPFRETPGVLHIVDQRKLPDVLEEYRVRSASEAAFAIREMIVRGAPAIG